MRGWRTHRNISFRLRIRARARAVAIPIVCSRQRAAAARTVLGAAEMSPRRRVFNWMHTDEGLGLVARRAAAFDARSSGASQSQRADECSPYRRERTHASGAVRFLLEFIGRRRTAWHRTNCPLTRWCGTIRIDRTARSAIRSEKRDRVKTG